jgi:hypothetical protein
LPRGFYDRRKECGPETSRFNGAIAKKNMKRKTLLVLVPSLAVSFVNCMGWKNTAPEEKTIRVAEFLEYKLDLDESQMVTLNRIRQELLVEY